MRLAAAGNEPMPALRRLARVPLLAALLLAPGLARPDGGPAQGAYARGQEFQSRRQWTEAVQAYMEALKDDPQYFYAYKSMGSTYYEAGDVKSALACFDRYLALNPGDDATRTFAAKLRDALRTGTSPEAAARAAHLKAGLEPGFRSGYAVGAGLGGVLVQADDVNKLLPAGSGVSFGQSFAMAANLDGEYGFENGVVVGAGFLFGPNRSHSLATSDPADPSAAVTVSNLGLDVSGGYRVRVGDSSWLEARAALGGLLANLDSSEGGTASGGIAASGLGYLLWPEACYDVAIAPNWVGSFSAGYMLSSVGVREGGVKGGPLGGGGTLALQTSGPSVRVGVSYCFNAPLM